MDIFDDDYSADVYPDFDYNRDGKIDESEETDLLFYLEEEERRVLQEQEDLTRDDSISELEDFGIDFSEFLSMNDAEKYKFLQDAVILNEFDYMEYFDDYARISGMDEELIELCEYGIDPYAFEDDPDSMKYQVLKDVGLDPEDYEEYFDDFDEVSKDSEDEAYPQNIKQEEEQRQSMDESKLEDKDGMPEKL